MNMTGDDEMCPQIGKSSEMNDSGNESMNVNSLPKKICLFLIKFENRWWN